MYLYVCRYPKCGAQRFNIIHSFRCEQDIKASGGKRNKENERVKKKKKNICKRNREMKKNKKRIWTTSDSLFQPVFFSFFLMKAGPSFNIYPVQTHTFHPHLINKTRRRRRELSAIWRSCTGMWCILLSETSFFLDIHLFWIWNIPRATAVNMEFFLLLFYPFFLFWYTQPHLSRCNVRCHQVRRRKKVFPKKKKKKISHL